MSESNRPDSPKREDVVSKSFLGLGVNESTALTVGSVFLFFLGWAYLEFYFNFFNLNLLVLDYPFYVYAMYAIVPLARPLVWELFALELLFIVNVALTLPWVRNWVGRLFERKPKPAMQDPEPGFVTRPRSWLKQLIYWVVLTLCVIVMAFLAAQLGKKQAAEDYKTAIPVHLTFKSGEREPFDPVLVQANKDRDLRLLVQTKDLVIVFTRPKSPADGKPKSVFILRRDDLTAVHIGLGQAPGRGRILSR